MTCAEFKELAALYALGGLDADERAACDAHLAEAKHDGCLQALADASAAIEALGGDLPEVPPGPHVWKGIERRIGLAAIAPRRRRGVAAVGWVVAAAAAAVAVFLWWDGRGKDREIADLHAGQRDLLGRIAEADKNLAAVGSMRNACLQKLEGLERDLEKRDQAIALLQLPGTQLFALAPGKDTPYQANAILHAGVKRAYVVATGLTPVPGKSYQMWVLKGKKAIPAGLIVGDAKGRALGRIDYATFLAEGVPDAVAVTIEREGGSQTPNLPPILAGGPKGG
ncbi:MAG TPA: anti-sigma factor [Haliangiales bacterium]|nr:anti-sigma factor [Haliangiales bacterium]